MTTETKPNLEERLASLEEQQQSTFDRTGLILNNLLHMKQMLLLLLNDAGIPIPAPPEKEQP